MRMSSNAFLKRHEWLLLFAALMFFFCIGLGARDFMVPTEARYIEIPRQMLVTGDWLTPHINGVPYFEKPPLFYWMQAAALWLFGLNEFGGRIVTALLAIGTCMISFTTARFLYSRRAGLISACVLASSLLCYGMSGVAALDMPVSFFITACLSAFLWAWKTGSNRFYYAMYAASALAVMTKGLIGVVIPGLVIGAWIIITHQWKLLKEVRLFSGLLLFLALAAPWHIAVSQMHPQFFDFYFIHEHFTRFLTNEHRRTAPWWFFIAVSVAGLLPWTGFLPGAIKSAPSDNTKKFLLLWMILPLLFFSSSHSKLISYIFPIFPPMTMFIGQYFSAQWDQKPSLFVRRYGIGIMTLFLLLPMCLPLLPYLSGKAGQSLAIIKELNFSMLLPAAITLAFAAYIHRKAEKTRTLIMALGLASSVLWLTAGVIAAHIDKSGIKPIAQKILSDLGPDDMVVVYKNYWQDLPVYLNQNVTIVDWKGELSFGYNNYPEAAKIMISANDFWNLCGINGHNVYVVIREKDLSGFNMPVSCRLLPFASHGKTVLLKKVPSP